MSAVSMYMRDLAEIRPALKTWVLKCSAAPPHVESVVMEVGDRLWHSAAVLKHTEKADVKLWGLWICGVLQNSLVSDF